MKRSPTLSLLGVIFSFGSALCDSPTYAAEFDSETPNCVARTWNGSSWVIAESLPLKRKSITQISPTSNGLVRFRIDSSWYSTRSTCIKGDRSPSSVKSQSVLHERDLPEKRGFHNGWLVRGAFELASLSRTLAVGSTSYQVVLSTRALKGGFGRHSFLGSSRLYLGWNLDAFFGVSSVVAETSSPISYSGSGILTLGSRGSGVIGFQVSKRIQTEFGLGVGASYARLKEIGIAATTSPKALGFYPLLKLGSVYQLSPGLGIGIEAFSQGIIGDFGFAGGLQWVL